MGSEETVRTFHSEECLQFIHQNYTPQRSLFFYQGKVRFERIIKVLEKWYDTFSFEGGQSTASAGITVYATGFDFATCPATEVIEEGHHQSHVLLGVPTFPIGHPDAAALALINNMLGGPGMNSRLNLALRERRGLVYNVESNLTHYTDTGYFSIYFGCDHNDVKRCLRLCQQEIDKMKNTPLSPTQLTAAKRQLQGQLGVSSANLENSAILMAKNMLRLGRVENLQQTCQRIDAVSPEQIMNVMNQLFDNDLLKTVIIQ